MLVFQNQDTLINFVAQWYPEQLACKFSLPSLLQPPLPSFHSHHSVIFVDSSGLLNVLCHLSLSRYTWLRHEAAVSLACLDNPATDGFRALFMTPVPFQMKFDLLIQYVENKTSQLCTTQKCALKICINTIIVACEVSCALYCTYIYLNG